MQNQCQIYFLSLQDRANLWLYCILLEFGRFCSRPTAWKAVVTCCSYHQLAPRKLMLARPRPAGAVGAASVKLCRRSFSGV